MHAHRAQQGTWRAPAALCMWDLGTGGGLGCCYLVLVQELGSRSSDLPLQSQLEMLPSAGVYYFPWEINSSIPEGEALRTFGR